MSTDHSDCYMLHAILLLNKVRPAVGVSKLKNKILDVNCGHFWKYPSTSVFVSFTCLISWFFKLIPLQVLALVFVRKLMDFFFTKRELSWLDDLMPESKKKKLEDAEKEVGCDFRFFWCVVITLHSVPLTFWASSFLLLLQKQFTSTC